MRIGTLAEAQPGETRVAALPETVNKLLAAQQQVIDQADACAPGGNTSQK